jgi:hypothetical protein
LFLKQARKLISLTPCKTINRKVQIYSEKYGWVGQLFDSDLDKLACKFARIHKDKPEYDSEAWIFCVTSLMHKQRCKCTRGCDEKCAHHQKWKPPKSLQVL